MKNLRSIRQLVSWLWKTWHGYRTQAALNTIVGLLLVFSDLAFVWATKLSIDIATHVNHSVTLRQAILLLSGIIVVQILLGIASRWIRAILGVKAKNSEQAALFARLLGSKWQQLKQHHSGHLLNRIEIDVTGIINFLTETLPSFVCTVVQFVGAFLFLFWMDRTLACIIVCIIPVFIICSRLYVRKMRRLTHDVRDTESRIQAILQESLQHTLVIKTLEQTSGALRKLGEAHRRLRGEIVTKTRYSTVSSTLMSTGFAVGYMVTFVWGVVSLEAGAITYGALIAFIQLVGQIQTPVRSLTKYIPVFINAFTAGERLMELEDIPQEDTAERHPMATPVGIRLEQVSFSYTPESRVILRDFTHTFPPGSITAIVGETGSGKTTLIRLLLALAHPTAGQVSLFSGTKDGVAEANSVQATPATRCNFAYVPQGNTLLSGTIRENLLMGNPEATELEMTEALHTAAADGFVARLPKGLETMCGEMGDGLSEGQAQRIAIARTLLRKAPILLLDEATSSLDSETERIVLQRIVERQAGRTLIFITHRPEVLKYATHTLHLERTPR